MKVLVITREIAILFRVFIKHPSLIDNFSCTKISEEVCYRSQKDNDTHGSKVHLQWFLKLCVTCFDNIIPK